MSSDALEHQRANIESSIQFIQHVDAPDDRPIALMNLDSALRRQLRAQYHSVFLVPGWEAVERSRGSCRDKSRESLE